MRECLSPGASLQLSLRFANKTGAYPSGAPFRNSTLRAIYGTYPQTLDKAGKACKGQTHWLITKILNYDRKKFYNIGPWTTNYKSGLSSKICKAVFTLWGKLL